MAVDFSGVVIDENLAKAAAQGASENWSWWIEDFRHDGHFRDLPLLSNYPRWRGFGADYSVFRGIPTSELDGLREWFAAQDDPNEFGGLYAALMERLPGSQRVSLVSKLLAIWRPTEYAMWDTLARNGLRKLHNVRGRRYFDTNLDSYSVFREDFFALLSKKQGELLELSGVDVAYFDGNPDICAARVLDNYLMLLGE